MLATIFNIICDYIIDVRQKEKILFVTFRVVGVSVQQIIKIFMG